MKISEEIPVNVPISEWHVRSGKYSRPMTKILYRVVCLLRTCLESTAYIALKETCNLPRYIYKSTRRGRHRLPGMTGSTILLPREPRPGQDPLPILHACIAGIHTVRRQWGPSPLGLCLYARGFEEGAKWMHDSLHACNGKEMQSGDQAESQQKVPSRESIRPEVPQSTTDDR
jgi:hypothetical protein